MYLKLCPGLVPGDRIGGVYYPSYLRGKGNCIAADGKLFFSTMKGELVVVRATPKSYQEIGRSKVIGTTRQAPALAGGLLYLRDDREIVCLDVRGK